MSLTEEKVTELKAKYGNTLCAIECEEWVLVFKPPSRANYDRFVDKKFSDPGNISTAARELAQSCLAFPTRDEMIKCLDAYPGLLLNEISDALLTMAQVGGGAQVKKL